ncbi:MAG: SPFH domain-containing protein [Clostridia bacterium]
MGFFQSIRNLFSRNARLTSDKKNELVLVCRQKGKRYFINTKVIVPKGFAFVFAHRGRVLDVLSEGTHIISAVTLPECCKHFKLYKLVDNKPKKNFVANGYFVLIDKCDDLVCGTNEKVFVYEYGRKVDWIKMEFTFSLRVAIPQTFMRTMFSEYEVLYDGESNKIISWLASDLITSYLKEMDILKDEIYSLLSTRLAEIQDYFKLAMAKYGVEIESLSVKKLQTKTNKNWLIEDYSSLDNSISSNEKPNEETELNPYITPKNVIGGNGEDDFMFETVFPSTENLHFSMPEKDVEEPVLAQETMNQEKAYLKEQIKKSISGDGKFVDLNVVNTFKPSSEKFICPFCGEPILTKAKFCPACGKPLNSEDKSQNL